MKKSISIFCSSRFRHQVEVLATAKNCTIGELVRSCLLLIPLQVIEATPDPGEPEDHDREEVEVKSGTSAGRVLRRKPRLQLRLWEDLPAPLIRQALQVVLNLETRRSKLALLDAARPDPIEELKAANQNQRRWEQIVKTLAFEPLEEGVNTREEALYVLGFHPKDRPEREKIRDRFRTLALIYHPDSPWAGDTRRMSQLNQAIAILK